MKNYEGDVIMSWFKQLKRTCEIGPKCLVEFALAFSVQVA